jgi:hypothetical protein
MLSFGNGQTNGLPLLVSAITALTAQLLHTAPVGAATPNVVRILASNIDEGTPAVPSQSVMAVAPVGHLVTILIQDAGAVNTRTIKQMIPVESGLFPILEEGREIILNGTCTISVFADEADKVQVTAIVDDQADVAGAASQVISSGLIAAVQNANRFGVGVQGGVGDATEANGQIMIPRDGTLRNLRVFPDVPVTAPAIVTVVVRKNGVGTALTLQFDNAAGVVPQIDPDSVAVAAGDLITFLVTCDNGGPPAANFQAAMEFV